MRIIFNSMKCGLGNQGGSSSIVKSANALVDLGHYVTIIDSGRNQHTWTPLKAKHLIIKRTVDIPNADAIIATGYHTVQSTLKLPSRCGRKFHWIRAWETWQMNKKQIISQILRVPTIKIVNSIGLKRKLDTFGVKSHIIRPGYDINELYPKYIRSSDKIILGGLYNTRHKTKRTEWILKSAKIIKEKYKKENIVLWMMGTHPPPKSSVIDKYTRNPSMKEKNDFYNSIHIWMATTKLEGLHIPPAEAMLTECTVMGTNAPMSGMQDYLEHNKTGLISDNNLDAFISEIKHLILDRHLREELGKEGRKCILEIGDRKKNMEEMISLLKK